MGSGRWSRVQFHPWDITSHGLCRQPCWDPEDRFGMKREGGAARPGRNDPVEEGLSGKMASSPNDSDHGVGSGLVFMPKSLTHCVGAWERFLISCVCLFCSPLIHSPCSCTVTLTRQKSNRIIL